MLDSKTGWCSLMLLLVLRAVLCCAVCLQEEMTRLKTEIAKLSDGDGGPEDQVRSSTSFCEKKTLHSPLSFSLKSAHTVPV